MSLSVSCYPVPGKAKSRKLLEAFACGAGGAVVESLPPALEDGAAAFFGVTHELKHLWQQARRDRRDRYYLDNAYFDSARGKYFRVAKNSLQAFESQKPDEARYGALKLGIQPWRKGGRHIVVCPQSDDFMRLMCSWGGGSMGWQEEVLQTLNAHTDRPIVVRHWSRDKTGAAANLAADLKGAHALVTHMSAAANEALIAGIPVFVTGLCGATPMASGTLERIESPWYPDGRVEWAAGLAAAQWTVDELKDGTAWRALNA